MSVFFKRCKSFPDKQTKFFSFCFCWTKSLSGIFVFFFLLSGVSVFFLIKNVFAQSTAEESAYRAAEIVIAESLEEIKKNGNSNRLVSFLVSKIEGAKTCSDGIIEGKNVFGFYRARFLNSSGVSLGCSDKISRISEVQVTGFFGGASFTVSSNVFSAENGTGFRCTGELPQYTVAYSGDDVDLSENLSWQYALSDTKRKCEYHCESGAIREGNSCVRYECKGSIPSGAERYDLEEEKDVSEDVYWKYSGRDSERKCEYHCVSGYDWNGSFCVPRGANEKYVTVGPENQVKSGPFGVRGAFKAYGGIDVKGKKVENVSMPIDGSDVASKAYVDAKISAALGDGNVVIDPLDPKTVVLLLSSHFDDELIWFEPWLHIADTVATPVMYAITPYQESQIGLKYLNLNSWILPQGKLSDEDLSEYRAHDRVYRKQYLTDEYITSLVDSRVASSDVIVTHSPWGEYGHEQHRQLFCVAQSLAMKYKKDLYVWNGMPDEINKIGGMPATYYEFRKKGGGELPFVSLEYHRNHYDETRNIFRQAELNYPQYHGGRSCDPETQTVCNFWSWDRTWNGVYGTYNPPTVAKYYKMIDRGNPIYDRDQQKVFLTMRPYFPDETVFGRRDCLVE